MTKITSEEIIEKIGGFGRFQIRILLLLGCAMFFTNMVLMVMTFSTAEPPWKCSTNSTSCTMNGSFSPGDELFDYRCNLSRKDWEFDVDDGFDSIVTEWDLVCDTAVYASLANSLTFLLWIFGSIAASILGDKLGRKIIFYPLGLFTCVVGFISAFAQAYWVFAVFRALVGIGIGGSGIIGYVYVMEFIGKEHRGPVGIMIFISWILCLCCLSLLGYLIQSWRILSIVTSIPGALTIFFWFFTPESIRWLMVKGKMNQAAEVIRWAAKLNKRTISEEDINLLGEDSEQDDSNKQLGDIRSLFASRGMIYKTLASWYCWFACAMIYYGITLSSPTVGGNMYLNFFVSAMCELGGMFVSLPCLKYLGRKKTMTISLWLAGVVGLAAALLSQYDDGSKGFLAGKILMSMVLGKFFITIAFDVVYLYSSELFPTAVRGTAMGSSTSAGRIGSAVSPYIVFSERIHPVVPFAIMAAIAIIGGALCMTLPETGGESLSDTIQQADKHTNQQKEQLYSASMELNEARA